MGAFDDLRDQSQRLLKRPPVRLSVAERRLVCEAIVEKFAQLGIPVAALSVCATHVHALAQFPTLGEAMRRSPGMAIPGLDSRCLLKDGRNPIPRHVLGIVKKHASHTLRRMDHIHRGGLWAARSREEPLRDNDHFTDTNRYITRHDREGGAVYVPD